MKTWVEPAPVVVPEALSAAVGGHPLLAERLARRGFASAADALRFLDPAFYLPASPHDLPDMDRAVERLRQALQQRETILVWGDFDVDGQTSTALLVSALQALGANVRYHLPDRFKEGHGIHLPTLKTWLDGGIDLVLTCDTGVSAHEAVAYARSRGVDVVITDHHLLPEQLPDAAAIVNPMRLPQRHPLRELPGAGTAYQLVAALAGDQEHLLDLVALGIVADVMVQVDDTRWLLQRGLGVLRRGERPGLRAMMQRAGINPAEVTEEHLGFDLAPRLNALGRLANANPAIELLTTADSSVIAMRVNQLEGMNGERKLLTGQIYRGALAEIERDPSLLEYAALVIAAEGWHSGILGVVASRLVERYQRPVLLLSISGADAHGSARSIPGCDITAALRQHRDLLARFGGHATAAGLSLPAARIVELRRRLSRAVREMLQDAPDARPRLEIDAYLSLGDLSLELAQDIARLAPFGSGNPPLVLAARGLRIVRQRPLGRRDEHLELTVADAGGQQRRVIWWHGADETPPAGPFDLAFLLRVSTYRDSRDIQLEWLDARPAEDESLSVVDEPPALTVLDYRGHPAPAAQLQAVLEQYPGALVWREGGAAVDGVDRYHLRAAPVLVVWMPPPGPDEWQQALEQVQPATLALFGHDPQRDEMGVFLRHLAGLVKYALNNRGGSARLEELAAAAAQREHVICLGLDWLAADGQINVLDSGDDLRLSQPGTPDEAARQRAGIRLQNALAETRAYRAYWLRQDHTPG